ncbi:MAG: hypothetical protein NC191_05995 [Muribaculaceae bacterium]|nr:hypothetical protein [Muribaculaceae bacterium]
MNIKSLGNIIPQVKLAPMSNSQKGAQVSFERNPIGDVFIRMESEIQQAARRGVDMPNGKKAIRKFSTDELKMLEMQIEEGNTLKDLAEIYKVSLSDMRKVLLKNGKDSLDNGEIVSKESLTNLQRTLNAGKDSSMADIEKSLSSYESEISRGADSRAKVSEEDLQNALELLRSGMPVGTVAKKAGLTYAKVLTLAKNNGILLPKQKIMQERKAIYDQLPTGDELKALVDSVKTRSELAKKLGIDDSMARKLLIENGFDPIIRVALPNANRILDVMEAKPYISVDEIADILKVEPELVETAARDNKIPTRVNGLPPLSFGRVNLPAVAELLKSGDSPVQIAELYGVSSKRVVNFINSYKEKDAGFKSQVTDLAEVLKPKKSPTKEVFMETLNKLRADGVQDIEILNPLSQELGVSRSTCLRLMRKYNGPEMDEKLYADLRGWTCGDSPVNAEIVEIRNLIKEFNPVKK